MGRTSRAEYERAVLAELRALLDPDRLVWAGSPEGEGWARLREVDHLWKMIEVGKVELDTSGPEHEVVVLLRNPRSFEHRFERRVPASWPDAPSIMGDANSYATILYTNLAEDVLTGSLPENRPPTV